MEGKREEERGRGANKEWQGAQAREQKKGLDKN